MEQHKKRRRRWPLVLICVVLALVLAVAGVAAYMYGQISAIFDTGEVGSLSQTQDPDIEANGERFYNLLVFGIDYDADDSGRTYAEGKGNTDVILYVQIDRDNRKVNVLQIPRDSWYGETMVGGITGYQCKINEVYANGPDQDHLVNNLANQIYEMYKLPIDNYVYIEMDAFKTMIDVMGGIEMYVPWDIVYIDKDTKEEVLAVPQGRHKVSGDAAELILRNRNYAQSDYKRLETQQYFYAAVMEYFLNECTLAGYYDTCRSIAPYLKTDLDITEIWGLYATMMQVEPSDIYVVRSPGGPLTIDPPRGGDPTSVYYTDRDAMAQLLNEHFRDPAMPVEAELLNLPTGYEWPLGKNIDPGRTLGDVDQAIQDAESGQTVSSDSAA